MKKKKPNTLLLGAHMSSAGGLHKAIERGDSIGCTAIQFFTKSNRQWHAPSITEKDVAQFRETFEHATHVSYVMAHASYLINLGSPKSDVAKKSVSALIKEVSSCERLGIPHLVIHPGAHLKSGEDECLDRIAHHLNTVLEKSEGKTTILLETMAGQGSNVCYQFEHIATIRDRIEQKSRIGVCADTCHMFAAGYTFETSQKYEHLWKTFDSIIGFKHLKAVHFNDSRAAAGSRVDRHEDIGKGKIGLNAFKLFMNDARFFDIPKILETPKESIDDDVRNMQTLVELVSTKNQPLQHIDIP